MRLFCLTDCEIDPRRLEEAVAQRFHGAVVTFTGVIRDDSEGDPLVELESLVYDAYAEMAELELEKIGREVSEGWGSQAGIAIWHRIGTVPVGEIAVAVVAAMPHRKEAFEVCRFAIDRVKETVPIWKREVLKSGRKRWADVSC